MNVKNDLLFCGNASLDTIICNNGTQTVMGGSSCNSAIAAVLNTKKQISLITSLGNDFPIQKLQQLNINTQNIVLYDFPSNAFVIDEIQNKISLMQQEYLPIQIPNDIKTNHLHVSCRRGVPFKEAFNKIKANTYSLDIMWSSVKDFLPDLSKCLDKANFLFCNDTEYDILRENGVTQSLPKDLGIMITDKNGVVYQKGGSRKQFKTIEVAPVISTVGAGDTFVGQFLSHYNQNSLEQSIYLGLAAASVSVQDFGNLHLFNKTTEIEQARKSIQNTDKQNDTNAYIYNRSIMQR